MQLVEPALTVSQTKHIKNLVQIYSQTNDGKEKTNDTNATDEDPVYTLEEHVLDSGAQQSIPQQTDSNLGIWREASGNL